MIELYVDPGYVTGWARFNGTALTGHGRIVATKADDRPRYIMQHFRALLSTAKAEVVYIEGVDMRGGRGNWSAIMRGDLTRLSYLIGAMQNAASDTGASVHIITPLWKGNLSKAAMRAQLKIMRPDIDTSALKEHEVDCVAMGVFRHADRWPKNWRMG